MGVCLSVTLTKVCVCVCVCVCICVCAVVCSLSEDFALLVLFPRFSLPFHSSIRVVKTAKQSSEVSLSYKETIQMIVEKDGMQGLFFRGLNTRILANACQVFCFHPAHTAQLPSSKG